MSENADLESKSILINGLPIMTSFASVFGLLYYGICIATPAKKDYEQYPNNKEKKKLFVKSRNAMTTMGYLLIPGFTSLLAHWGVRYMVKGASTVKPTEQVLVLLFSVASLASMIAIITKMAMKHKELQQGIDDETM